MSAAEQLPLSVTQQALWVAWQLQPDAYRNVISTPLRVRGELDPERLARAVRSVGERFPTLRGVVRSVGGDPVLSWAGRPPLRLQVHPVAGSMQEAVLAAARVSFDLENDPLCRFDLLRRPDQPQDSVLVVTTSHLIYDGVSVPNLLAQLRAGYRGEPAAAEAAELAELRRFHQRQHDLADGPAGAEHRAFWRAELGSRLPGLDLPAQPDRGDFQLIVQPLPERFTEQLRVTARQLRLTPMVLLYAAYLVLLRQHTGQDDLVVSFPTHGRRGYPALQQAVGFFSNALPLRRQLRDEHSYAEVARELGSQIKRCLRHAELPQPAIVRAAESGPGAEEAVLGTIFQYWSTTSREDVDLFDVRLDDGCSLRLLPPIDVADYRLQTLVQEDADGFSVSWKDVRGELGRSTLELLAADYLELLTVLLSDPDVAIGPATPSRRTAERRAELAARALLDRLYPDLADGQVPAVTPHQQRMAFVDRFENGTVYPGPPTYHNLPLIRLLDEPPDAERLAAAFTDTVAAHAVLRTNLEFGEAGFRPRLRPPEPCAVRWLPAADELGPQATGWIAAPFELAGQPLLRCAVQPRPDGRAWLLLVGHQAVVDRASLRLIADRLTGRSDTSDRDCPEFADWFAQQWRDGRNALGRQLQAVCERLPSEIEPLRLPESRPRDAVHVYREAAAELPELAAEPIQRLATAAGVPAAAVLLAGFAATLSWYTGQDELVLGTTQPARTEATAALIGPVSNLVPIRLDTGVGRTFGELVNQAAGELDFARRHAGAPFDDLVRALDPAKDMSRTALFDVLFSYLDDEAGEDGGLTAGQAMLGSGAGKYDLQLAVRPMPGGGHQARLVFNGEYFDQRTFEGFALHLHRLLAEAAGRPEVPLGELAPLSEAEQRQQLRDWNDSASGYPELPLGELLRRQAERTPDAVAVTDGERQLSYRQLLGSAEAMAGALVATGVRPGDLVALHLRRGSQQVEAVLAVLLAGAGYLPIDPAVPEERKHFMLADSRVDVLIAGAAGEPDAFAADSVLVLTVPQLRSGTPTGPVPVGLDDPAYCIYTSGTTGRPKGVVISHRNVVRLLLPERSSFDFGRDDVWTLFHSYHFDFSVWEIFGCLVTGGRLVLVSHEQARDSQRFAELLRQERVSVLNQTPGAFYQLIDVLPGQLPDLRYVIFGGDRLDTARIAGWAADHPQVRLINMYGITEVTVHATVHPISPAELADGRSLVGRPIPTSSIYLLDRRTGRRLLPVGAVGEVYVGGLGVAGGYLRRPELSRQRFLADPLPGTPTGTLFRSGDLGRWHPDGNLELLGRADSQVKLRGYRIELGEVEARLREHELVSQACVQLEGGSAGRLVCYVQAPDGLDPAELRAHAASRLPSYMVPTSFLVVPEIPLTSNGKVDRAALSALARQQAPAGAPADPVIGDTGRLVAELWTELLGASGLTGRSSFFELGGHSLLAARLLAALSERVGASLPLRLLFEHPRLQEFAEAIDRFTGQLPAAGPGPAEPIVADGPPAEFPAASFQERILLAERMDPNAHRYLVPLLWRVTGTLDLPALETALAALVRRHEILRTRFIVRDGRLCQAVGEPWQPRIRRQPVTDIEGWLHAELAEPIDPAAGQPLRLALLSGPDGQLLALTVHHLAWDLESAPVLWQELAALCRGAEPAPPTQYREFVAAQQRFENTQQYQADLAYWRQALAGASAYPALPAPASTEPSGAVPVPLPADLGARLADLQTRQGVSWFMAAATALAAVLHRYTDTDDLCLGLPVDNRELAGDGPLFGPCLNTVVLRSRPAAGATVGQLLAGIRESLLTALEHRLLPFETVVNQLNPPRQPGATPFAEVMLNVNIATGDPIRLGDAELNPVTVPAQWDYDTKFAITLTVTELDGQLGAMLAYRGDRLAATDARQLASLFGLVLGSLPELLDTPVATVELTTPAELQRLAGFEAGPPAAPPSSIPAMMAERAAAFADRPAIRTEDGELSYTELDRAVGALAARLRAAAGHGRPDGVVALLLDRGPELVIAELASWRAGFPYCPIDPSYPAERIEFLLSDLSAVAAVTDRPELAELATTRSVPVVNPVTGPADGVLADAALPDPDSPACLIYTSGTTGQPKGSIWRHRGIAQLARWHIDTLAVTERDRASLLASVGFDGAQWELWPYLAAGACVLPYRKPIAVSEVVDWLDAQRISMCFMPTPLAEVMVSGRRQPRHLRWLTIGGTTFTTRLPADAGYRVCNAYGPSENTVVGSVLLIDRDNTRPVNDVGRPIQGTSVAIVDDAGQRVPAGVPGEILLGGVAVADGYWRRPELTAQRFLPGPWYRTGDRGRWSQDGHLMFSGRTDRQLKVRGYRIEPHEIEVALQRDPLVRQALVTGGPDSSPALVGYLVATDPAVRDSAAVIDRLANRLPAFMIPDALVWLPELPTSVHGKLDLAGLPRPGRTELLAGGAGPAAAPRTGSERQLAAVWTELLGLDEVGVLDSFFDLGGNSLKLSMLHARLEALLGRELPIHRLFEFSTIRALARWLDGEQPDGGSPLPDTPARQPAAGRPAGDPGRTRRPSDDDILDRARRSRQVRTR